MSSCINVSPTEQLCYIPCNFCNIVLAVSVPCSSLHDIVTVRCGHCTNLWSVNMAAAFQSLQPFQNGFAATVLNGSETVDPAMLKQKHFSKAPNYAASDCRVEFGSSSSRCTTKTTVRPPVATNTEGRAANRPPEKRQRVPSAYNQFIKEEIQRIKANNPDISHREAFSTAAKNWAHFPHIHFGLMLESNNQSKLDEGSAKRLTPRPALLQK